MELRHFFFYFSFISRQSGTLNIFRMARRGSLLCEIDRYCYFFSLSVNVSMGPRRRLSKRTQKGREEERTEPLNDCVQELEHFFLYFRSMSKGISEVCGRQEVPSYITERRVIAHKGIGTPPTAPLVLFYMTSILRLALFCLPFYLFYLFYWTYPNSIVLRIFPTLLSQDCQRQDVICVTSWNRKTLPETGNVMS